MKKWFIIVVALLIIAVYIIFQNPAYRAWFERQSDQLLPDTVTHNKLYRWRDRNGQWQLSDQPPADGIDYEIVEYHKDTNVIPSEKLTGKSDR